MVEEFLYVGNKPVNTSSKLKKKTDKPTGPTPLYYRKTGSIIQTSETKQSKTQ